MKAIFSDLKLKCMDIISFNEEEKKLSKKIFIFLKKIVDRFSKQE